MKNSKNLLEELAGFIPDDNKVDLLEVRSNHVISSAINLIEYIRESFNDDVADDLEKRLILSIKNQDIKRFNRGIAKIDKGKDV
ncbi:hypothetical protein NVP2275O_019 [Vibrio phage 2.275.O._10N.286.54.E11]|nr:hypothetical protein NVP2275O_019 [Vibrio phage 2.275.O._10N.286.54.E11]